MEKNIGVLVVTYNRPKDLDICLKSIENQTYKPEAICILDNASSKETLDLLEKKGILTTFDRENIEKENFNFKLEDMPCYLKTIKTSGNNYIYLRLKENTGGSGGFYYGLKYLHEYTDLDGYYILDDDGMLDENCLKEIIPYTNDYLSITSLKLDRDNPTNLIPHTGYCIDDNYKYFPVKTLDKVDKNLEISFSSFVGWYFAKSLIEKVGYPKKDFFISIDDIEYSFRIKYYEFKTLLLYKSKIYHPSKKSENLPLFKYFFGFKNISYLYKVYYNEENNTKREVMNVSTKLFYEFIRNRFNFNLSFSEFLKFLNMKNISEVFKFLNNYKFNNNFLINEDFIVFSTSSYLRSTQIYKHPNFKGAIYFEKKSKFFNIPFDNITEILKNNKELKILLQCRDFFVYKITGHLISKKRQDLINRIIV